HIDVICDLYIFFFLRQDGIPIQAFVAVVLDEIVGVAIVRNEEDIEYIRSHYNIEDFIYFNHHKREEHGHLYHFAVNPIFNHFSRHFLKEILRLSHKSCLYYPIHMASSLKKSQSPHAHSLTSALYYLIPVRPRRQIIYPLKQLGINVPSKRIYQNKVSGRSGRRF
uniref:Cilia- and flagella-associated protein 61 N-terminal domain-containing protein n=1 Tax=Callorhinchus milii TaxID=7868 RepID=A0A4W3KEW9_CALMI